MSIGFSANLMCVYGDLQDAFTLQLQLEIIRIIVR